MIHRYRGKMKPRWKSVWRIIAGIPAPRCHLGSDRKKVMGSIHVTTTVRARENARKKYVSEFLVDTGATDSLAPAKELKKAGIKPRGRMAYELADGQTVEYAFGLAEIEFMGEITSGRVIFGPDDAAPLLGVTALESVGILVDPANRTLRRMPAIPLKSAALGRPSRHDD